MDAGLAVITLPPQGSGHQPWQAVKRWTSSPSGNLNEQIITQRAAKLPVSKQKTNMILYDRHVGLLILRGTESQRWREKEFRNLLTFVHI